MRVARKSILLAIMALALSASAAASAFGQTLEVEDELNGGHCPPVSLVGHTVTGGCEVHGASEGEVTMRQHVFGIESTVTTCETEGTGRVNEDGEGYATQAIITSHGACNRQPCDEETGTKEVRPAHGVGREDSSHPGYSEIGRATFCSESPSNTSHPSGEVSCLIDVPGRESEINHQGESGEPPPGEIPGIGTAGFRCELIGHWMTEAANSGEETNTEVIHL